MIELFKLPREVFGNILEYLGGFSDHLTESEGEAELSEPRSWRSSGTVGVWFAVGFLMMV